MRTCRGDANHPAHRPVTIVARDKDRAGALASRVQASGLDARVVTAQDVHNAQLIVSATSARAPLLDRRLVPDDACVVAIGSHAADSRELDSTLVGRAQLVVEDTVVALRESGDLIIAIGQAVIAPASLVPMRDIITGQKPVDHHRPRVQELRDVLGRPGHRRGSAPRGLSIEAADAAVLRPGSGTCVGSVVLTALEQARGRRDGQDGDDDRQRLTDREIRDTGHRATTVDERHRVDMRRVQDQLDADEGEQDGQADA